MMLLKTVPELQSEFENQVCCLLGPGPIGDELEKRGIPVTYLELRRNLGFTAIYRFFKLIRQYKPDILITYLIHADLFGRVFGRLFGIKVIICSQRGSLHGWQFLRPVERLTRSLVTSYTAQTEAAKQELMQYSHLTDAQVQVIPNTIRLEDFSKPAVSSTLRKELGLPAKAPVLIFVANLLKGKGHAYLLQAFEEVTQQVPDIHLLLVGEGPERTNLENRLSTLPHGNQVHLLGRRKDIIQLLQASTLFVFPSLAEGMSNALLEGMAAGLPCVVSDIEVNREVIQDEVNGLLFRCGDPEDLVRQLLRVLSDPVLAKKLSQAARKTVAEEYDQPQAMAKLISFFHSL